MGNIRQIVMNTVMQDMPYNFDGRMDHVRSFIQKVTVSKSTTFDVHDINGMLKGISSTIENDTPPISTLCGHRAKIFEFIAEQLGYRTRWINTYTDTSTDNILLGHVFNEVMGYDGLWYIVDSDLDIYYKKDDRRLGIEEAIVTPFLEYSPYNELFGNGWDITPSTQNLFDYDYFRAVLIRDKLSVDKVIFTNRFNYNKVFTCIGTTAIKYFRDECNFNIIILP